jgi:hypothetical protein
MELFGAGLLIGAGHLAVVYVLIHVMRLPYGRFLAAQFVATLVLGAIANAMAPTWKKSMMAALDAEKRQGRLGTDILLMFGAVIVSALISAGMIYSAYGVGGVLGSVGAALLANALV